MGRKSSSKEQRPATPPTARKGFSPALLGVGIVVLLAFGAFALWGGNGSVESATVAQASSAAGLQDGQRKAPPESEVAKNEAAAKAMTALGPHKQDNLPPLPVRGYAPPRPMPTVVAAFQFAAEHPEVLSYVPCFCGCQNLKHRGNEDCFVKSRAKNGDVVEWEEHGIECAVCIDVATRARQMYASGASLTDIREAVEKEYSPKSFPSITPTPKPPAHSH